MKVKTMTEQLENSEKMSLIEHLVEMRTRVIYSFLAFTSLSILSYLFAQDIYGFLVQPLAEVLEGQNRRLIYTGLAEVFFTYIKLAVFAGGFLSFPFIAYQIWAFVAPGLYKNEKKFFMPFLAAIPVLFAIGAAFVYYIVMPMAWQFFASFQIENSILPIQLEAKVDQYLSLVMGLIFAFGLCFQMPVILVLLARIGVITSKSLISHRRYAIVIIFAIAAVLTPPDVVSQLLLGIPLIFLYELSVILVKLMEKS